MVCHSGQTHDCPAITVIVALELRLLDNSNGDVAAVNVALPDMSTARNIAEAAKDSSVAKPDWDDLADMIASATTLVALAEIDDCAVLSELLDNDALLLANTADGRSAFTDTVA